MNDDGDVWFGGDGRRRVERCLPDSCRESLSEGSFPLEKKGAS